MLQDNINQPVSQNQTASGIAAEDMSKEQKSNVVDFATILQNEASSYLPDVYEASAGCVESHRGVVVKMQIFHGNQPLIGGDILIQEVDKEQEEWEEQAEEITSELLAQSINELLQNDNNTAPKGS